MLDITKFKYKFDLKNNNYYEREIYKTYTQTTDDTQLNFCTSSWPSLEDITTIDTNKALYLFADTGELLVYIASVDFDIKYSEFRINIEYPQDYEITIKDEDLLLDYLFEAKEYLEERYREELN